MVALPLMLLKMCMCLYTSYFLPFFEGGNHMEDSPIMSVILSPVWPMPDKGYKPELAENLPENFTEKMKFLWKFNENMCPGCQPALV